MRRLVSPKDKRNIKIKYRKVKIFTGEIFEVPEYIQRIEKDGTHGWQLRYGKWKLFSDHSKDGSRANISLDEAKKELILRIKSISAPTGLSKKPHHNKTTNLPIGISGPKKSKRSYRSFYEYCFQVTIPRFGKKPTTRPVYIGTENTYTVKREKIALEKAIEIRKKAEEAYQLAATEAKRKTTFKNI